MTQPRGTVGASEIGALFDEHPYVSRYSLWARECGLLLDEQDEHTDRQEMGLLLERPILDIWARREFPNNHGTVIVHNTESFKLPDGSSATPDGLFRLVLPSEHIVATVDVKTVQPHERHAWLDGIPRHYWWQKQQQTRATGAAAGYLVAAFGFTDIAHTLVEADEEAHERITKEVATFWKQVRGEMEPPTPDGHRATLAALFAKKREPKTIVLDDIAEDTDRNIRSLTKQIADLKKELNAEKAYALKVLGDADSGVFPNGSGWKVQTIVRKEYTAKASTYKKLSLFSGDEAEEGGGDVE